MSENRRQARRYVRTTLNFVILLLVLTSLVWSGGCTPGAKAPEVILIGATLPETGPFIGAAGPFRALLDTWAEMVNEDGGLYVQEYGKRFPYALSSTTTRVTGIRCKSCTRD